METSKKQQVRETRIEIDPDDAVGIGGHYADIYALLDAPRGGEKVQRPGGITDDEFIDYLAGFDANLIIANEMLDKPMSESERETALDEVLKNDQQ